MNAKFLRAILLSLVVLPASGHARSLETQGSATSLRRDENVLDDPIGRLREQEDEESGSINPEHLKWLNQAAARERLRTKSLLPGTESAVPGSTWVNIGPNKANFAKWDSYGTLNKTDAGRVVAIVPDPTNADILYLAMSGGGVWKTTDALSAAQPTWTPMTETLGTLSCGALAIDPTAPLTLYLGLGDAFSGTGIGFTKSTDGGATWEAIRYLGDSTKISDIHVVENNSSILLVATDKGLFRSTDRGATFAPVPIATGNTQAPYCWGIAWSGGTNYVLTLEANHSATSGTTDGQVFYSSNSGATWTRASGVTKTTGIGRVSVASSPLNRSVMYAMAAIPFPADRNDLADFFRSSDGGRTWVALNATAQSVSYTLRNYGEVKGLMNGQGAYNQMVLASKSDQNSVFFGGTFGVMRADKAFTKSPTYTPVSDLFARFSLPYVHCDLHAAAYDRNGNFYVGTDGGIFMSSNNGTGWTDSYNIGLVSHLIYSVGSTEAAPDAVIGGLQDNGTRLRVANTSTFNQIQPADGSDCLLHPLSASKIIASKQYSQIYASSDGGATLTPATGISEAADTALAAVYPKIRLWRGSVDGNTVFTHTNFKVYKSTDFGASWTALGTTGFLPNVYLRNIAVAKTDPNVLGLVASGGRVFLSSDGGASWTLGPLPPNTTNPSAGQGYISFDDADRNVVYVASRSSDPARSHLWRSADFGASWTILDTAPGFPTGVPVNTIVADPNDSATLYAGTYLGVYRSTDTGASWSRFGAGMPLVNVTDFYISPDSSRMRAATFGRGFWELRP